MGQDMLTGVHTAVTFRSAPDRRSSLRLMRLSAQETHAALAIAAGLAGWCPAELSNRFRNRIDDALSKEMT